MDRRYRALMLLWGKQLVWLTTAVLWHYKGILVQMSYLWSLAGWEWLSCPLLIHPVMRLPRACSQWKKSHKSNLLELQCSQESPGIHFECTSWFCKVWSETRESWVLPSFQEMPTCWCMNRTLRREGLICSLLFQLSKWSTKGSEMCPGSQSQLVEKPGFQT